MTERKCILSGDRADPETLIRLAIGPEGQVMPDVRAKEPGRGAWIGVSRAELETALAEATRRFESDFSEENFAEQQRIRALKADHDSRLAELAQSEDIV